MPIFTMLNPCYQETVKILPGMYNVHGDEKVRRQYSSQARVFGLLVSQSLTDNAATRGMVKQPVIA
jgi:hypothetical protein